jgi:integrase
MPSKERCLDTALEEYLTDVRRRTRNEDTVKKYRWMINKVNTILVDNAFEAHPTKWDQDTVQFLRDDFEDRLEMPTARWQFSILNKYLLSFGNTAIQDAQLRWPPDTRTHVTWMTPEQAVRLTEAAEGIERIIIHLELNIFMRRIEVLRLRVQDIGLGYINICGKGPHGGKWRTNPFHPDTHAELSYYFKLREYEIAKARSKDPAVAVPDELLIYERKGRLHPYKRSAVDGFVASAGQRIGIELTNHMNRRTGLRACWLAGVDMETIRDLAGHEDSKTTALYIGVNMDDKSGAMFQLAKYQAALARANPGEASVGSGRTGMSAHETIWLTPKMPRTGQ